MERTIPIWRAKVAEHGDEDGSVEWAGAECERYIALHVTSLFSGALNVAENAKRKSLMNSLTLFHPYYSGPHVNDTFFVLNPLE